MKHLLILVMLSGCVSTSKTTSPAMVVKDVHDVYDLTISALTELRHDGVITDEIKAEIEKVRAPVYDAMNRMDNAILAEDMQEFDAARLAYNIAIPALRDWLFRLQQQRSTTRRTNDVGNSRLGPSELGPPELRQGGRDPRSQVSWRAGVD